MQMAETGLSSGAKLSFDSLKLNDEEEDQCWRTTFTLTNGTPLALTGTPPLDEERLVKPLSITLYKYPDSAKTELVITIDWRKKCIKLTDAKGKDRSYNNIFLLGLKFKITITSTRDYIQVNFDSLVHLCVRVKDEKGAVPRPAELKCEIVEHRIKPRRQEELEVQVTDEYERLSRANEGDASWLDDYWPKVGEIIQINRNAVDHFGIYVGIEDGKHKLIHYNGILLPGNMVAKDDIEDIAGDSHWFVQRYYDRFFECKEPWDIVEEVEKYLQANFAEKCKLLIDYWKSRDFAMACRYKPDTEKKYQMKQDVYLQKGDVVMYDRPLYNHYALYMGHGRIMHKRDANAGSGQWALSVGSSSGVSNNKALIANERWDAPVKKKESSDTTSASQPGPIPRERQEQWEGKAFLFNGCDTQYPPLPADKILSRALSKLETIGYNLLSDNCENFANNCRYGETKLSSEVLTKVMIAGNSLTGVGAGVGAGVGGAATGAAAAGFASTAVGSGVAVGVAAGLGVAGAIIAPIAIGIPIFLYCADRKYVLLEARISPEEEIHVGNE